MGKRLRIRDLETKRDNLENFELKKDWILRTSIQKYREKK